MISPHDDFGVIALDVIGGLASTADDRDDQPEDKEIPKNNSKYDADYRACRRTSVDSSIGGREGRQDILASEERL